MLNTRLISHTPHHTALVNFLQLMNTVFIYYLIIYFNWDSLPFKAEQPLGTRHD